MTSARQSLAQVSTKATVWNVRPFQLVSLFEMLANYAFQFVQMLREVESTRYNLDWERSSNPKGYFEEPSRIEGMRTAFQALHDFCAIVGIDLSNQLRRANEILDTKSTDQFDRLSSTLDEIINRIEDELRLRMFIFIPPDHAVHCDKAELFGADVAAKFPEANKEIRQAGNCYAIGSYTACVFHLMRAVEHGARALVKGLRVTKKLPRKVELCDWGDLIGAVESGLKTAATGRRKSLRVAEKSEFYNHAVGQFRNFKDAWRNNVSHTRKIYQQGETKDILDNTRQFMQQLATRLKE